MGVQSGRIRGRLRVEQYRFGCYIDPLLSTTDDKRHIDSGGRIRPQKHIWLMVGLKPGRLSCDLVGCRKQVVESVGSDATGHRVSKVIRTHVAEMNFCSRYCAAARVCNDASQGSRKCLGEGPWWARRKENESNRYRHCYSEPELHCAPPFEAYGKESY